MSLIPPFSLMLRAHVLNQTHAKVQLVERHFTKARFGRALKAVENRQTAVGQDYMRGQISLEQLQQKIARTVAMEMRLGHVHEVAYSDGIDDQPAQARPVDACALFQTRLRSVQWHRQPETPSALVDRLEMALSVEQTQTRDRRELAGSFWSGQLTDYANFREQVTALAQREWTERQGPGSAPATPQQTALKVLDILHHLRQAEPRGPNQSWHPNIIFFDPFSSDLRREAAAALAPDNKKAYVAEMQQALASAFWAERVSSYEALQGHVDSVAEYAAAHLHPDDPKRAERVCKVTFETLQIIRQQHPTPTAHARVGQRALWRDASKAVERFAVDRLRLSRQQWNAGKSD